MAGSRSITSPFAPGQPTTATEAVLLVATVASSSLEGVVPTVRGFSIAFILFGILFSYAFLRRLGAIHRTLRHPLFLTAGSFLGVCVLMETVHAGEGYRHIARIGLMLSGALAVASLCRDRRALLACMLGLVLAGAVVALTLMFTVYVPLRAAEGGDFLRASLLRRAVFSDHPLGLDLNSMAFLMARGAVVAFALWIGWRGHERWIFLSLSLLCTVGTFLPMSRGGVASLVVAGAAVAWRHGPAKPRVILAAVAYVASVALWVPDAALGRLDPRQGPSTRSSSESGQPRDVRVSLLRATLVNLPEYALTGVGVGPYHGKWGKEHGFYSESEERVLGTHNCFSQVTVYWGIPALLLLLALAWQAYRCIPRGMADDPLALGLCGIASALLLRSMLLHELPSKEFSVGLGVLAAAALWIWPKALEPKGPPTDRHCGHRWLRGWSCRRRSTTRERPSSLPGARARSARISRAPSRSSAHAA